MVAFPASGSKPTNAGLVKANTPGAVEPEALPEAVIAPEEAPLELPEDAPEAAPLDAPVVGTVPLAAEPELGVPALAEPVPAPVPLDAAIPEVVPIPEPELVPVDVAPLPEPLLFPDPAEGELFEEHPASPSARSAVVPAASRHTRTERRERACTMTCTSDNCRRGLSRAGRSVASPSFWRLWL
jgi:hypothetical protein